MIAIGTKPGGNRVALEIHGDAAAFGRNGKAKATA